MRIWLCDRTFSSYTRFFYYFARVFLLFEYFVYNEKSRVNSISIYIEKQCMCNMGTGEYMTHCIMMTQTYQCTLLNLAKPLCNLTSFLQTDKLQLLEVLTRGTHWDICLSRSYSSIMESWTDNYTRY